MTNLWIAIPDSSLIESQTILDKSYKISQISRSCSIFRVNKIIIYHDRSVKAEKIDEKILKTILEYLDTPPYLRKKIYSKMWILKHAGILPPIKSPHHKALIDIKDIKDIEIRFGFVVKQNDSLYVDVGLQKLIRYNGTQLGKKVLVKISNKGKLLAEDISKEEIESVNYNYADLTKMMKKYNPEKLKDGFNTVDGEEIFYISNPALGLWSYKENFKN